MENREVLVTESLTKLYGDFVALNGLNLSIKAGTCIGYLGPNGSGKSTTIKVLTGLSKLTSGSAYIFGHEIGKETRKALLNVGAVVETPVFQPFLTPVEILSYFGKLRGMSSQQISSRTKEVLEIVKLGEWSKKNRFFFKRHDAARSPCFCSAPRSGSIDTRRAYIRT
jgi:ABC-type multidrug transport system ATPase subunit